MKLGLIGTGSSGKTSLFSAVTLSGETDGGYRAKGSTQIRVVQVPDDRLVRLRDIFHPRKYTPATVEYVDVAGGSDAGGRDQGFYTPLRDVTGFVHVLRAFDTAAVPHPKGRIDPLADADDIYTEMILRDLEIAERRVEKLQKQAERGRITQQEKREAEIQRHVCEALNAGRGVSSLGLSGEDEKALRAFGYLTGKPMVHVLNVAEGGAAAFPEVDGTYPGILRICARLEAELAGVPEAERKDLADAMGVDELAAFRLIRQCYQALGLGSFFTVGEDEVRAWTFGTGETALECAGHIHSDLARGFIRAEVVSYDKFVEAGSLAEARNRGTLRLEGKDYAVQDGDIMHVRFSV